VRGWDRRNAYYSQLITSLAQHYGFDTETPFEELPEDIQDIVLHGSGTEVISFSYLNERRGKVVRKHTFEGIISNMKRRYRETESSTVREELARYLSRHAISATRPVRTATAHASTKQPGMSRSAAEPCLK